MDAAEFDQYAEAYERQHAENIAISGEGPEYFARYKITDTKAKCDELGLEVSRILDFGAGIGNSVPYFQELFSGTRIVAADVSEKSLGILERRYPTSVERLVITEYLELPTNSIDLAFTACVFHHIPADEHLYWLREIRRVLRPGGLFALFEHNPYNPLTVRAVNTCPFDENAVLIKAAVMKQRLENAGWENIDIRFRIFFPNFVGILRPFERFMTKIPLGAQYVLYVK